MEANRILTQEELAQQAAKEAAHVDEYVVLLNRSSNQTVPIQLRAPDGMSFWTGEQCVSLYPRQMAKFPKARLYAEQIENCQKSGLLRVLDTVE